MQDWKINLIKNIIVKKQTNKIIFVHTPKCGGTFVSYILNDLGILNKGHNLATDNKDIHFTVIRHPVDRFESLLNFRLSENKPRNDWPKSLVNAYNYNTSLNKIVKNMTDNNIMSFSPYHSLTYYSKNVDVLITIGELTHFLKLFGYSYDEQKYSIKNESVKTRGKLNNNNRMRIGKLFFKDIKLYNLWTRAN